MALKTVVGLSCNTRMTALCVMRGKVLEYYQISLYKNKWDSPKKEKILKRLSSLLKAYTFNELALVIPYENHSTENITSLLESLTTYFEEKKIKVCPYYPQSFHQLCEGSKTKKALMESVCILYPELLKLYVREKRNKTKYYVKLFEAVAAVILHTQRK